MVWEIFTGGPILPFTGTLDEVKAHVEKHAPMKRGWTGAWHETTPISWHYPWHVYRRSNSKGRELRGFDIAVRLIYEGP